MNIGLQGGSRMINLNEIRNTLRYFSISIILFDPHIETEWKGNVKCNWRTRNKCQYSRVHVCMLLGFN